MGEISTLSGYYDIIHEVFVRVCPIFTITNNPNMASLSGPNWPKGPGSQDQTGRNGQKVGPNWPGGPVYHVKGGPKEIAC